MSSSGVSLPSSSASARSSRRGDVGFFIALIAKVFSQCLVGRNSALGESLACLRVRLLNGFGFGSLLHLFGGGDGHHAAVACKAHHAHALR